MSSSVHFHLEQMLPSLKAMQKAGILSKTEQAGIIRQRTKQEFALHRRSPQKQDYLHAITYETNLLMLARKRMNRTGVMNALAQDYGLLQRIHGLYTRALSRSRGASDPDLWIQYLEWAKASGGGKALAKGFARFVLG
jgi:hypothetical protein